MSAQLFLPTPHCPCIGPAEVPFTHPDGVPRAVLGWVTTVANRAGGCSWSPTR